MYFVFTIVELNLLLPCFGLWALYLRIYWKSETVDPAPGLAHLKYGRGSFVGSIWGRKSLPSPFPFLLYTYSRVEWYSTYWDFWKRAQCCYILFISSIPKNSQALHACSAHAAKFNKSQGFLNWQILNTVTSFYLKEQSAKSKFEIKSI